MVKHSAEKKDFPEIDYDVLYDAMKSIEHEALKPRFSGQVCYYDQYGRYTDYIVASEATAESIALSFAGDKIEIGFIKEPDGSMSLSDKRHAETTNRDFLAAGDKISKKVADIL